MAVLRGLTPSFVWFLFRAGRDTKKGNIGKDRDKLFRSLQSVAAAPKCAMPSS